MKSDEKKLYIKTLDPDDIYVFLVLKVFIWNYWCLNILNMLLYLSNRFK